MHAGYQSYLVREMKQNIKEGIVIDKAKEGMEAKKGTDFVLLRILFYIAVYFVHKT